MRLRSSRRALWSALHWRPSTGVGGGGTSFAAPIMAGIQALINEATGSSYQGNPNYIHYALGALEYDLGGAAACDATLGNQIDPHCVFHDVTLGDNDVPCQPLAVNSVSIGTFNCYLPSGANGVLSLSNISYKPAWPTTRGGDFATGLGTVNALQPGARGPAPEFIEVGSGHGRAIQGAGI
jgi:subtilase family serine protease